MMIMKRPWKSRGNTHIPCRTNRHVRPEFFGGEEREGKGKLIMSHLHEFQTPAIVVIMLADVLLNAQTVLMVLKRTICTSRLTHSTCCP